MRTWIFNRVKVITGLADAAVISSGSADNPAPPFVVVQMDIEQPPLGISAETRTQWVPFTTWVHDAPGSMIWIDTQALLLKDGLPTFDGFKIGNLSVYRIEWVETGQDTYDDHFETNTRPVMFRAMTRR